MSLKTKKEERGRIFLSEKQIHNRYDGSGRPSLVPTEDNLALIFQAGIYGVGKDDAARLVDVSPQTFENHFRETYNKGRAHGIFEVSQSLNGEALGGDVPSMKFYLECQAKWSKQHKVEISIMDLAFKKKVEDSFLIISQMFNELIPEDKKEIAMKRLFSVTEDLDRSLCVIEDAQEEK